MKNSDKKMKLAGIGVSFIFAIVLFFPFIFHGQFFVGSEGNFLRYFPNFLFCHRAFNAGEWGLWNPYLNAGMDFTASGDNVVFDPLNWILFSFPEQHLFFLLSLRMFLETFLIGVFGYLFFREELKDDQWALLSSMIYQMSGYLYAGLLMHANLTVVLFFTIAVYLVFTLQQRRRFISFLFLTIALSEVWLAGQLKYGLTAFVVVGILAVYRYKSFLAKQPAHQKYVPVIGLALGAAFMIASIRLWPVAASLWSMGGLKVEAMPALENLFKVGFLPNALMTFFEPYPSLVNPFVRLGAYELQYYGLLYGGALPMAVFLLTFNQQMREKINFWVGLFYAGFTLWVLQVCFFSPIGFFNPKLMMVVSFCVIVGHLGRSISGGEGALSQAMDGLARFRPLLFLLPVFGLQAAVMLLVAFRGFKPSMPAHTVIFYNSIVIAVVSFLWIGATVFLKGKEFKKYYWPVFGVIWFFLFWVLDKKYGLSTYFSNHEIHAALLTGLDILKWALIVLFFGVLLSYAKDRKFSRSALLAAALFLTVLDLIPFSKIYSALSMSPFFSGELYPSKDKILRPFKVMPNMGDYKDIVSSRLMKSWNDTYLPSSGWENVDIENYRVNRPELFLKIAYDPLRNNNIAQVYRVRSDSGKSESGIGFFYDGLKSGLSDPGGTHGVSAEERHKRFLDLLGFRYGVDSYRRPAIRETALARFMFFSNFKVLNDEETFREFKKPGFDPLTEVIFAGPPDMADTDPQARARPWPYVHVKNNVLAVHLKNKTPGFLFFGDSYNANWKAAINGKKTPIIRANYNFMGIPVAKPGHNIVILRFEPKVFYGGLYWLHVGVVLSLLWAGYLYAQDRGLVKLRNLLMVGAGLVLALGAGSLTYFMNQGEAAALLPRLFLVLYSLLFYIFIGSAFLGVSYKENKD